MLLQIPHADDPVVVVQRPDGSPTIVRRSTRASAKKLADDKSGDSDACSCFLSSHGLSLTFEVPPVAIPNKNITRPRASQKRKRTVPKQPSKTTRPSKKRMGRRPNGSSDESSAKDSGRDTESSEEYDDRSSDDDDCRGVGRAAGRRSWLVQLAYLTLFDK